MSSIHGGVRKQASRNLVGAMIGVLTGLLIVGLIFMAVQTYILTNEIRYNQKINLKTNALIASCVMPKGSCYKAGQKRTGDAVSDIGSLAVYAAACADKSGNQTVPQITACVLAERDKADRRKK